MFCYAGHCIRTLVAGRFIIIVPAARGHLEGVETMTSITGTTGNLR